MRVYDLTPTTVRVDGTTASGYWEITEDGLFQFGHSKDHRPVLPQIKVMLAALDPLGMLVAVDVLPGQHSDDQLYLPIIDRVRASLGRTGVLDLRAALQYAGDHYLCPLGRVQLPAAALKTISRPDVDGHPVLDAAG